MQGVSDFPFELKGKSFTLRFDLEALEAVSIATESHYGEALQACANLPSIAMIVFAAAANVPLVEVKELVTSPSDHLAIVTAIHAACRKAFPEMFEKDKPAPGKKKPAAKPEKPTP